MVINKKHIVPIVGGVILIVTIAAGTGLLILSNLNQPKSIDTNNSLSSNSSSLESINNSTNTGLYKNGTYSANGSYLSPGGHESIGVTITVANDKITSVSVTATGPDPESIRYEKRFASGISSIVVGKTLDQATVSGRVNGSSLTGDGFNAALTTIIEQAKV